VSRDRPADWLHILAIWIGIVDLVNCGHPAFKSDVVEAYERAVSVTIE